jgi:cytochrome c-type biogenesis protein CcmF
MNALLAHASLVLALAFALALAAVPMAAPARWLKLARPLAALMGLCATLALACLAGAFVRNDTGFQLVALHSSASLPVAYRVAGAWASHEGSLLLWFAALALWTAALARSAREWPPVLLARTLGVLGGIGAAFALFLLLASDPFTQLAQPPAAGRDLNPLLQHPAMVAHPPLLTLGYAGLALPFALAVAALIGGEAGPDWARRTRRWATLAWCCLTLGIALGSVWAYDVLGWGGWWFWDPVENASFMPWLCATALIHSLAAVERRGALGTTSLLLALLGFGFSLLGTFLVRSGVLSSVHAFANDPQRGLALLVLMALVVGAALALHALRAPAMTRSAPFSLLSRESALVANNVLLLGAAIAVLAGTLCPLLLERLDLGPVAVGAPYFDAAMAALMTPMAFLMGIGPLARWGRAELPSLARRLRAAALVSVLASVAVAWAAGHVGWLAVLGIAVSLWIASTLLSDTLRTRGRGARAVQGMRIAHLGVAVFALGVSLAKSGGEEREVAMRVNERATLAGESFVLRGVAPVAGANYDALQAVIDIERDGRVVGQLQPQRRLYRLRQVATTEAAIERGLVRDLYVSLGDPLDDGRWLLRLQVKRFIGWIWAGCLLMALGGAVAASGVRTREPQRASQAGEARA